MFDITLKCLPWGKVSLMVEKLIYIYIQFIFYQIRGVELSLIHKILAISKHAGQKESHPDVNIYELETEE